MSVVAQKLGKKAEAEAPRLPAEAAYIWASYIALDATRQSGFGPGAISYVEMAAFAHVHRFRWTPFEIAAIRDLDRAFLVQYAEQQKEKANGRN